ncbi:hypothetical protein [Bordetella genomosp. 1]|nr:hypothetical protein [Bordetella genomosp. 1]
MAASTLKRLCVFMTPADEQAFALAVLAHWPSARFVDLGLEPQTPAPPLVTGWPAACRGRRVTLVDGSRFDAAAFHARYVAPHPGGQGWAYAMVGAGLVNLWRSAPYDDMPQGLRNGELRATIPAGDPATAAFAKAVFAAAKAGAAKVYAVDAATGALASRAEPGFIAGADAAARYDGQDGAYLNNHPQALFAARR